MTYYSWYSIIKVVSIIQVSYLNVNNWMASLLALRYHPEP